MPATLTWLDRLRIERVILTVDVLISYLPMERQYAILSELRANLHSAAAEVGTREAVRRLGGLRRLASGYLDAELGEGRRRPQWLKGVGWALVVATSVLAVAFAGNQGFMDGVRTADPHATGTYVWHALTPLVPLEDVTLADGRLRSFSFSFSLLALPALFAIAFVLGARAWRWLPGR